MATEEEIKLIIDHLVHHSVYRIGMVYDFTTVCNAMANRPREYEPGLFLTMVEVRIVLEIAQKPGITASELCKTSKRTRSAMSQIVKKLKQKNMVYGEASNEHQKRMLLYPTEEGMKLRNHIVRNKEEDKNRVFTRLIEKGCSVKELESFYKVMDIYMNLMIEEPKTGWDYLIPKD